MLNTLKGEYHFGWFAAVKFLGMNLGKRNFRLGLGKAKRMLQKNLQRFFEWDLNGGPKSDFKRQ